MLGKSHRVTNMKWLKDDAFTIMCWVGILAAAWLFYRTFL